MVNDKAAFDLCICMIERSFLCERPPEAGRGGQDVKKDANPQKVGVWDV